MRKILKGLTKLNWLKKSTKMVCSSEQIDVWVFINANSDDLVHKLKVEYSQQITRRYEIDAGFFRSTYDKILSEAMYEELVRFLCQTFNKNIEEMYVICESERINNVLISIVIRSFL